MQDRLVQALGPHYRPPVTVHGFVRDRSFITGARRHIRKRWVLSLDLADFFPSIHFGRVRGVFSAHPYNYPVRVATLLAQICCHKGALPQGAPTSPFISNLICRSLDSELTRLARNERCDYTRYADDIVFSTDRRLFPDAIASPTPGEGVELGTALLESIQASGFRVNHSKTRLKGLGHRQRVTGLVVNDKCNVPREYYRLLRTTLYIWRARSEAEAAAFIMPKVNRSRPPGKSTPSFRSVMRGRVQYVGQVKGFADKTYVRLARSLASLDEEFQPASLDLLDAAFSIRVYTEGPTDHDHLEAALKYFQSRGDYVGLRVDFVRQADVEGDDQLWTTCRNLARHPQDVVTIGVFDRDRKQTTSRIERSGGGYEDLGNNVLATCIERPPWRAGDSVCIEMLYEDAVLGACDSSGRRMFLRSEFSQDTGAHRNGRYYCPTTHRETLVLDKVFAEIGGPNVALSKTAFSTAVKERRPPYLDVQFEGFRPTFEHLLGVLRDHSAKGRY